MNLHIYIYMEIGSHRLHKLQGKSTFLKELKRKTIQRIKMQNFWHGRTKLCSFFHMGI